MRQISKHYCQTNNSVADKFTSVIFLYPIFAEHLRLKWLKRIFQNQKLPANAIFYR